MKRVTFTKDYPGAPEAGGRPYKAGETGEFTDYVAGQIVAGKFGDLAADASDPASPKNLAGVDGHPIDPGGDAGDTYAKGAAGTLPGDDVVAGVKVDDKAETAEADAAKARKRTK